MKERIRELAEQTGLKYNFDPMLWLKYEKFADLIIDECCLKLIAMHEKTNGNHNYYKHAALEVARHFGDK